MDVFKTNRPEAILALASAMADGFPTSGALVLFFSKNRSSTVARVPNPDIDEVTQWAEGIGATTAALGANGIIPIFLGGEEDVSQFRQVAAQLIEHTDLRVLTSLMLTDERWLDLHDMSQTGSVERIADAAAELGVKHNAVRVNYGADAIPPAMPVEADQAAEAALLEREAALTAQLPQLPDLVDEVLRGTRELDDVEVAELVMHAASKPAKRDVMLMTVLFDAAYGHELDAANNRWIEHGGDEPLVTEGATIIMGLAEIQPDLERLKRGAQMLHSIAQHAPRQWRAPVLTALAWVYYAIGQGNTAYEIAQVSHKLDSEHTLTRICLSVFDANPTPTWILSQMRARHERAAEQ